MTIPRSALALVLLGAPACASASATVVCPPGVPHFRYVGNHDSTSANYDKNCTDDSIQAAIDAVVCPNTTIFITPEREWTGEQLTVSGKSFTMVGEPAGTACGSVGTTGVVFVQSGPIIPVLTIAGDGAHSVLAIGGNSNITLQFIEFTGGGGGPASRGGGIDFDGTGSLTLDTVTVDNNRSESGGGIEMNGDGGGATLTLGRNAVIQSNTAVNDGGGINLEGNAQLVAVESSVLVSVNTATNGNGGGLNVAGPATANIAGSIVANNAVHGGGIAIHAATDNGAAVNLYTTSPNDPVSVNHNFASRAGGGVYLIKDLPFAVGSVEFPSLCAQDFMIDNNRAPEGAAIEGATPSIVYLNVNCGALAGAVSCIGNFCNEISGNQAVDSSDAPHGSAISITSSVLDLNRTRLQDNSGQHVVGFVAPEDGTELVNCLISDNAVASDLLSNVTSAPGAFAVVNSCTIANNTHGGGNVVHTEIPMQLLDTIIDQPDWPTLDVVGGATAVEVQNLLTANLSGLLVQQDIQFGEPNFVDPANRDYRLNALSFRGGQILLVSNGIDFAPPRNGDLDLDGNPHDVDVPLMPDRTVNGNVRDLGCYEAQPILDRLFADGFGDPMSLLKP